MVLLIQVSWSIADDETREHEIKGLLEASSVTGCDNLLIITDDEKDSLNMEGKRVDVIPAWEWLLGNINYDKQGVQEGGHDSAQSPRR